MRCDDCQGKGVVVTAGVPLPCAECGGLGLVHCCEGFQAQPEDREAPCAPRQDQPPPAADGHAG